LVKKKVEGRRERGTSVKKNFFDKTTRDESTKNSGPEAGKTQKPSLEKRRNANLGKKKRAKTETNEKKAHGCERKRRRKRRRNS